MGFRCIVFAVWVAVLGLGASVPVTDAQTSHYDAQTSHYGQKWANKPDSITCTSKNRCQNKVLKCPTQCPKRIPSGDKSLGCFLDCHKCEPCCRRRKPHCKGFGALCYDPRFVGGDGVMFYFHGKKDEDFCLLSDRDLHINAHFIGKRPEGRTRDYTWVQSLGIMFLEHKLTIGVKKVAIWNDQVDQLFLYYDDMPITISRSENTLWISPDEDVVIERTAIFNSVHLMIYGFMEVFLTAVPITQKESQIHNYQITNEDCFAHLDLQFRFFSLSNSVNGILGQTYQPDFQNPVKRGVPMPIMGGDEKYSTSSLHSADCKVARFGVDVSSSVLSLETSLSTLPTNCESSGTTGITCRR